MIPLKTLGRWLRPGLLLSLLVMLTGCDAVAILSPKGQIGQDEKTLLITATVLMLLVVIPVIIMTLTFAWKYRASNTKARYEPKWSHSTAIEVVVWSIPCMIVLVLAVLTWRSSHALDPYRPLDSDVKPVTIEAISLDWKWLFIYPEEKVAVVNEIKFPVNTPLNFKITSDSVMNAFFIPHLGSMIYSMAAMETKLHLIANETGEFPGMSSHYSGAGFAKMHFTAYSVTDAEYRQWLDQVRAGEQGPPRGVERVALAAAVDFHRDSPLAACRTRKAVVAVDVRLSADPVCHEPLEARLAVGLHRQDRLEQRGVPGVPVRCDGVDDPLERDVRIREGPQVGLA